MARKNDTTDQVAMSIQYPRCETCDHHKPATNQVTREAMLACLNGSAPTKGMETPDDYGCVLHSDLEDDED